MHGEALTLIAIGAMVFVALSFPRELRQLYDVKFGRGVMA
jgi:transketolase C-terminal domain/subunit